MRGPMEVRFWAKVELSGGCWQWKQRGPTRPQFWINEDRPSVLAYRLVWEMLNGPIPDGGEVCHHCDNGYCVRPDHLFLATHAENMRDMARKGRADRSGRGRGEQNPPAKLTWDQVRVIRSRSTSGERRVDLARIYGVAPTTISAIVNGVSWRDS